MFSSFRKRSRSKSGFGQKENAEGKSSGGGSSSGSAYPLQRPIKRGQNNGNDTDSDSDGDASARPSARPPSLAERSGSSKNNTVDAPTTRIGRSKVRFPSKKKD